MTTGADHRHHHQQPPVAVITGASRGLGALLARRLGERGYALSLAARSRADLDRLAADLPGVAAPVVVTAADLARPADRVAVLDATLASFGRVDLLVNNAATAVVGPFQGLDPQDAARVLAVDLEAPMHLSRLVLDPMREQGSGHIVNVTTLLSQIAMPGLAPYSAAKAGLEQFTRVLRRELAGSGVRASYVSPGLITGAGMLSDMATRADTSLPPLARASGVSVERVAEVVLRTIETGRAAAVAAPGGRFMTRHPRLAAQLMRASGMDSFMQTVADSATRAEVVEAVARTH